MGAFRGTAATRPVRLFDRNGYDHGRLQSQRQLHAGLWHSNEPDSPTRPWQYDRFFSGGYPNPFYSDGYGLAFDVTWTGASDGDYLVATVDSPDQGVGGIQEVILVMDGRSAPDGTYPVAFNADISGTAEDVGFAFYLVPASGSKVEITVANFRRVIVSGV